jgi:hypothetical protein
MMATAGADTRLERQLTKDGHLLVFKAAVLIQGVSRHE